MTEIRAALHGGTDLSAPGDIPRPPEIKSLWELPPDESEHYVLGTNTLRLNMWADSDNSGRQDWVNEPHVDMGPHRPYLLNYWDGKATEYTLTLRRFWRQMPRTYTHVSPGGGYSKDYEEKVGITESDSFAISAELNVSVGDLGAKISATFKHDVTTVRERLEKTRYDVSGPEKGMVRVWVLWQAVDELVALAPDGKVIPEERGRGDVRWDSKTKSGAYLHYPKALQRFPSEIFVPIQKDFPESAAPAGWVHPHG